MRQRSKNDSPVLPCRDLSASSRCQHVSPGPCLANASRSQGRFEKFDYSRPDDRTTLPLELDQLLAEALLAASGLGRAALHLVVCRCTLPGAAAELPTAVRVSVRD
jgi:hypothetical protein